MRYSQIQVGVLSEFFRYLLSRDLVQKKEGIVVGLILVVGIPSARHVELTVVVHCSDVVRAQRVEDVVVVVSSDSHWIAVRVNQFELCVVCVACCSRVVNSVRVVAAAAAADVVCVVIVVLNEAAVVVEISANELAAEIRRVRSGKVADAVESLIRSCDVDASSSVCVECSVACRSGDVVSSLLVGSVAGSVVGVRKVAGLLISLDHHRAHFDGNSNSAAGLFFLLMVSACAATAEAKSDVSTVLVAAASPVGPEEVAAIALN